MLAIEGDPLVKVGAKGDNALLAGAGGIHLDAQKRDVGDFDLAFFLGGDQPVAAVGVARQGGCEKLNEFLAVDGRAVIKPLTLVIDANRQIAAEDGSAVRRGPSIRFSGIFPEQGRQRITHDQPEDSPLTEPAQSSEATELIGQLESAQGKLADVLREIGRVIFGQQKVIEETLITLLAGGHVLLIGVPGLGKTRLVETMGQVLGLDERRVQFTPDLMPADILGSEVLEEGETGRRSFRFIRGPIFCQLLMADEINRASPRTQSALLQAMQERRVSVAGHYHDLPAPFHVLATQNPLEQEGTYPLPEAQLDRFLMQVDIDYPQLAAERDILTATTGAKDETPATVIDGKELIALQRLVRLIPVGESVLAAILDLVRAGRPTSSEIPEVRDHVAWGPGPRASQALMLATRARALLDGRLSPSIDDVVALAPPVLRHRMALNFAARADGVTIDNVIDRLCAPLA